MHPAEIICALNMAGYTLRKVGKLAGLKDHTTVSAVIHGHRRSFNVATLISQITDIPMNTMWPDGRYATPPEREAA